MSEITITVDSTDELLLKDEIASSSVWVQNALKGKIHKIWIRFKNEWTNRLMNDSDFTDPIPSNKADFVALILARSDYKNAVERQPSLPKE